MSDQRSEKEKKGGVSRQRELHTHGTSDTRHPRRGVAHTPSSQTLGGGFGLSYRAVTWRSGQFPQLSSGSFPKISLQTLCQKCVLWEIYSIFLG